MANSRASNTISVIIPALNESPRIARAVTHAWQAGADEVIVTDGGSTDDTTRIAQQHGAVVVTGGLGRARQMNCGAAIARGDIFVFQHADNWFAAGALGPLKRFGVARAHHALGAFRQHLAGVGLAYRLIEWGNAVRAGIFHMPYGDQGIFVGRQLFDLCGRFPDVMLMEEVLLVDRARRYARPQLLQGPLHVDVRRWQRHGILRQTIRNWCLISALRCGVPLKTLIQFYPRHDRHTLS